jgi:NADH-quinone oxidoreductase subunit E
MSVRRLAVEQPASFGFTPENLAWAKDQIAKYPPGRQASAVIPLLWRAQEQNDYWLPKPAIEYVADMLEMPRIRVLEVATFYTMFNLEPVGKYFVQLCGTTPCRLCGAGDIIEVCEERIGPQRKVTADGLFSWLEVECLGACCNAPMVQINNDYYEDLTPENFRKLLDDLAAGRPVKKGSQTGRSGSEPQGAVNTLQDPSLYDGSVVGAWKKRFEEEDARNREAIAKAAADKEAADRALAAEAAANPKPGRPSDVTNATKATDTPAHRVAAGKEPVSSGEKSGAADPTKATVSAAKPTSAEPEVPLSDKPSSYVATPSEGDAKKKTTRKKASKADETKD